MAHGYAVIYVFVQVFVCICSSSNIKPRLCRPLVWVLLWGFFVCVCVAHFVTRSSGSSYFYFLFLGEKTRTRCVLLFFLRTSYVDALKKKRNTDETQRHFVSYSSFSSLRLERTFGDGLSSAFLFPFFSPATHSDTLARRCVCDKVALKNKKHTQTNNNNKKQQRTHVIRAAAGPICHEVSFQILSFLNGCSSYYCYCCHIGESLCFLSIF